MKANSIIQEEVLQSTEIKVEMELNERLIVTKRKKECKPIFLMINRGEYRKCMDGVKQMNTLKIVANFNATEEFAFNIILDNLKPLKSENGELYTTCHLKIDRSDLSNSDKVRLSKGLAMLSKRDVIVKSGKSSYMINPLFIIPYYFEIESIEYQSIKSSKIKK